MNNYKVELIIGSDLEFIGDEITEWANAGWEVVSHSHFIQNEALMTTILLKR